MTVTQSDVGSEIIYDSNRLSCRCSCGPHVCYTILGIATKALKAMPSQTLRGQLGPGTLQLVRFSWTGFLLRLHLRSFEDAEFLALKSPSHNDFHLVASALAPDTSVIPSVSTAK